MFKFIQIIYHTFFSWNRPGFYLYRKFFKHENAVTPDEGVDIVIESAGGTALYSFLRYVKDHNPELKIAMFTHSAGAVKYAIRHHIPVIVLTRNPFDSIKSLKRRFADFSMNGIIIRYMVFHASLAKMDFVVGSFDDITHRPQNIIEAANEKYGLRLCPGDGHIAHHNRKTADEPEPPIH